MHHTCLRRASARLRLDSTLRHTRESLMFLALMAENMESVPDDTAESLPPSAQTQAPAGLPVEQPIAVHTDTGGLQQYPASDAVRFAAESGMVRNQAAKILLQSLVQLRETDLADTRQERRLAREEGDRYKENFFKEQTKSAVLAERLRGDLNMKKLQNAIITLGGALLGVGLQPLLAAFSMGYFLVALLGLLLLLIGWFYPNEKKEQN
jgi:hypothetical protein